jgi:hypothetical protein
MRRVGKPWLGFLGVCSAQTDSGKHNEDKLNSDATVAIANTFLGLIRSNIFELPCQLI